MTFTPGQTGHTAEHNSIRADLDGRLSDETLAETFVGHGEVDGAFATVLADPESESATALNAAFGPDGTAGNISKQTAQGVALVQALIFGGN